MIRMEIKTTKQINNLLSVYKRTKCDSDYLNFRNNVKWVRVDDLEKWIKEYHPNNRSRKNVLKDLLNLLHALERNDKNTDSLKEQVIKSVDNGLEVNRLNADLAERKTSQTPRDNIINFVANCDCWKFNPEWCKKNCVCDCHKKVI